MHADPPPRGASPLSSHPEQSLIVVENSLYGSWTGLDPCSAAGSLLSAIYGNLFEIGPKGTLVDDLATGYTLTDGGQIFTMTIRQGSPSPMAHH